MDICHSLSLLKGKITYPKGQRRYMDLMAIFFQSNSSDLEIGQVFRQVLHNIM